MFSNLPLCHLYAKCLTSEWNLFKQHSLVRRCWSPSKYPWCRRLFMSGFLFRSSLKLQWNGQQEPAACFGTAAKWLENMLRVYHPISNQTATNQIVASYVNTDFWLDKITREARHTTELNHLPKTSLPWAAKTRQHVLNLLPKKDMLSTFCNNFS